MAGALGIMGETAPLTMLWRFPCFFGLTDTFQHSCTELNTLNLIHQFELAKSFPSHFYPAKQALDNFEAL